jgi:hypothetical protein
MSATMPVVQTARIGPLPEKVGSELPAVEEEAWLSQPAESTAAVTSTAKAVRWWFRETGKPVWVIRNMSLPRGICCCRMQFCEGRSERRVLTLSAADRTLLT